MAESLLETYHQVDPAERGMCPIELLFARISGEGVLESSAPSNGTQVLSSSGPFCDSSNIVDDDAMGNSNTAPAKRRRLLKEQQRLSSSRTSRRVREKQDQDASSKETLELVKTKLEAFLPSDLKLDLSAYPWMQTMGCPVGTGLWDVLQTRLASRPSKSQKPAAGHQNPDWCAPDLRFREDGLTDMPTLDDRGAVAWVAVFGPMRCSLVALMERFVIAVSSHWGHRWPSELVRAFEKIVFYLGRDTQGLFYGTSESGSELANGLLTILEVLPTAEAFDAVRRQADRAFLAALTKKDGQNYNAAFEVRYYWLLALRAQSADNIALAIEYLQRCQQLVGSDTMAVPNGNNGRGYRISSDRLADILRALHSQQYVMDATSRFAAGDYADVITRLHFVFFPNPGEQNLDLDRTRSYVLGSPFAKRAGLLSLLQKVAFISHVLPTLMFRI